MPGISGYIHNVIKICFYFVQQVPCTGSHMSIIIIVAITAAPMRGVSVLFAYNCPYYRGVLILKCQAQGEQPIHASPLQSLSNLVRQLPEEVAYASYTVM